MEVDRNLEILKRLGPDPSHDDFDRLYESAKDESMITFLVTMRPPKDLTRILSWHLWWLGDRFPGAGYRSTGTIEAVLRSGARWEEIDPRKLNGLRRSLLRIGDYDLKRLLSHLERLDICAPETYHELMRMPRMQQRLLALGLVKKPVTERGKRRIVREKRADEIARLMSRYDRGALYEQVWSQPVLVVAKEYRISGVTDWGLRGALFARVLGPSHSSALRCPAEIP